jgi:hypothetical protein
MYKIFGKRFHAWTTSTKKGKGWIRGFSNAGSPKRTASTPLTRRLDREVQNAARAAELPIVDGPGLVKRQSLLKRRDPKRRRGAK